MRWVALITLLLAGPAWSQPAPVDPPKSRVVLIERPSVVNKLAVDPEGVRSMFVSALQAYTGQRNVGEAWRTLGLVPTDVVGIKINSTMGTVMSTRRPLVDIVVETLQAAGVSPQHIIIWDKFGYDLENTGWLPQHDGEWPVVKSVVPGAGFDGQQFYVNEVIGRLIWGDYLFRGKKPTKEDLLRMAEKVTKKQTNDVDPNAKKNDLDIADQTSNRSYVTSLVTQTFTKIINIPVMADHNNWGISGCMSSLAIPSVDNSRRFADEDYDGDPAIPEILNLECFRKKVIFHIMDGLVAQYAGGPQFVPLYTQSIGALYLSKDPVAIDSLIVPRLENWRRNARVVPIGDQAKHIQTAAQMGLGQSDPKNIELVQLN